MSLSETFIRRPVATLLLAAGLFMAGTAAFLQLPIAPLPRVDFPTISVGASLPGADPETMAATVAAPLERRLGEIAGVSELTSSSGLGSTRVTAQFDLDRDIQGAAHDVQAAINASGSDLPVDLPNPPTYRKLNPADAPILILAVTSSTLPIAKLYDACDSIMAQRISQVEGVAQVTIAGGAKPAVRVEADPARLAAMNLSLDNIRTLLSQSNVNAPKGVMHGPTQAVAIGVNDELSTAAGFAPLLVPTAAQAANIANNTVSAAGSLTQTQATTASAPKGTSGGITNSAIRLGDIAHVTDGVENDRQAGWFNKERAIIVIIQKQADANVIETIDRIQNILPQVQAWMPAGSKISVLADRTQTIRASVHDIELTLLISVLLVVLVVYVSLGRVTPTIAASVTVPLSLAGTFAVMWLLDYSLNNISLMALIVCVGFVVDDAIVMIENIARHIDDGDAPLEAAIKGAKEITFTVVSITVSLIAVFIPLLFMGGIIGRLFREFAVTLSVAILISALVSLTVTPTIYGHLMNRRMKNRPMSRLARWGQQAFDFTQRIYNRGLHWTLAHQGLMLLVMLASIGLTVYLYIKVPKGFFPQQDTGMIQGMTQARSDTSFQAMAQKQQQVADIILADPAVESLGSSVGAGGFNPSGNRGQVFITLKPQSERSESSDQIIARLRPKLAKVEGIETMLQSGQDIRAGGRQGGAQFQFVVISDKLDELREWTPKLVDALKKEPGITDVNSDQDAAGQQVNIVVDRDMASRLGIDMQSIDGALNNALSQRQVSTIYAPRNQYHVVLEATPAYQQNPNSLDDIFIKTNDGRQVRLSTIARFERGTAPLSINHQGQFPAATLSFNLAEGASLGEAADTIQRVANQIGMPPDIHTEFAGNAKAFTDSLKDEPMLIGAALLAIYIVLGILYENTLHPITILSTLPSAGIGALLALIVTGTDLSIISIIGVILLMGIVKKNGIMLVDFAILAERDRNMTPEEAMIEAADKRFRPILMTTLAAVLGAVPLIVATGNGAELRRPLGIAIVGGLIVSQLLTLYTTPVVYLALERLRLRMHRLFRPSLPSAPAPDTVTS